MAAPRGDGALRAETPRAEGRSGLSPLALLAAFKSLPTAQRTLLGVLSTALVIEMYDRALLSASISFIANDFGLEARGAGRMLSVVELGALPAVLLAAFADEMGRRRVFLALLAGACAGTGLTAFAGSASQLVAFQAITRACITSGAALAVVIAAEELPAGRRGFGIAWITAIGGSGHAVAALMFSGVEWWPGGWRALYFAGWLPLAALPWLARHLVETRRFRADSVERDASRRSWLAPLAELIHAHPLRAAQTLGIGFSFGFGAFSVMRFTSYHLLEVEGWAPYAYGSMVVLIGGLTAFGDFIAGPLSDRVGRRGVACVVLAAAPGFSFVFFQVATGLPLAFAWGGLVVCHSVGMLMSRALCAELFPTPVRASASGLLAMAMTLGGAIGLLAVGGTGHGDADHSAALPAIACATLMAALLIFSLPETADSELAGDR